MKIDSLFDAALKALREEDEALRACFKTSDTTVAHGLTYWLFETTLVYFIFKAWLPKVNVLWEHTLEKDVTRRPSTAAGRLGAHEKCDLAIKEDETVVAAFEAKWWNNNSRKTRDSLVEDANKLRRGFPPSVSKYLVTFWWGEKNWDKDIAQATAACEEEGFELVKHGKFETKLLGERDGYFAMAFLKVD